ncbi:MAG: InlB B-repeat-containing protein [Firmicutes bacterium]|nr:InlB B-repeat-containing protein [Bacillota bacterium]
MKLKIPLFAFLLFLVAALPLTVAANGAVIDVPLDFTLDSTDPSYPGESGDGWSWDAGTKVLTLSGINIDVDTEYGALVLPDGAEIVLDDGTENNVANSDGAGILCCEGSLEISGGGDLNISAGTHGIRAYEDLTIDMTGEIYIEVLGRAGEEYSDGHGLRVGNVDYDRGDLIVRNCSAFSINNVGSIAYGIHQGIRCDGDVAISNCDEVSILVPSYNGIRNFGDVTISGCGRVSIAGFYNGIRSAGDVVIADCPDIEIKSVYEQYEQYELYEVDENGVMERPDLNGIYTTGGSVTIAHSALTAYGAAFGITTGPTCPCAGGATGGDIVIDQSTVHASCSAGGYAAIFAGDDVYNSGTGEHARIVLNGCEITVPAAGRIVDVSIDFDDDWGMTCQSVTALPGIEEITEWSQAAKNVVIEPPVVAKVLTVHFDSQGGSAVGSITISVSGVITPPEPPQRDGYTFGGWYKEAACINAWDFENDEITEDMTLYARWIPAVTPAPEDKPGDLPATYGHDRIPELLVSTLLLLGVMILSACCRRRKIYT